MLPKLIQIIYDVVVNEITLIFAKLLPIWSIQYNTIFV